MSVELLLLIVFILLPLIQQLLRAGQEREQGQPRRPTGPAPREPGPAMPRPTPRSRAALSPAPVVPPAVPPVPPVAVPSRAPSRGTLEAAIPVSPERRSMRRQSTMGRFLGPGTLRDAIALMTILGPCRAIAGDDEPPGA